MSKRKLIVYETLNGVKPFDIWFNSIKDPVVRFRISSRIDRLRKGNLGDCKSLKNDLYELRLHFSSGYRIYYSELDNVVLLLLCGGDKGSQNRDIKKANQFLKDYMERIK